MRQQLSLDKLAGDKGNPCWGLSNGGGVLQQPPGAASLAQVYVDRLSFLVCTDGWMDGQTDEWIDGTSHRGSPFVSGSGVHCQFIVCVHMHYLTLTQTKHIWAVTSHNLGLG